MEGFLICTQNESFISEWISPQKALFQGAPTLPYSYLLLGQVLSDRLLENHDIKPKMVQGEPVLLSQYADDTYIYMMYKQASYQAFINTLEDFSECTGLQINYKKSTVYCIGALRHTSMRLSCSKKLTQSNDTINVLGIKVNLHNKDTIFVNYIPLLQKIQSVLQLLQYWDLSLMGKIHVISTLVISLMVYKMSVLSLMPKDIIHPFIKLIRDYVWKGRRVEIAYHVLTARKDQGGFNLANIEKCDQSLKISWVFHVEFDQVIENLAYYFLNNQIRDLIWQCSIALEDVCILIPKKKFWRDVLNTLAQYNILQPLNQEQVLEQVLWLNSAIHVKNLSTINIKAIKRGML